MADKKLVSDMERLVLRVPDELRARLAHQAKASGRSMNTEAVAILSQALSDPVDKQLADIQRQLAMTHQAMVAAATEMDMLQQRRAMLEMELSVRRAVHGDLLKE